MQRVIYAWNYVEWGGSQIHFLALIKEARKEFETTVVLPIGTDNQFLGFLDAEQIEYRQFRGHIDNRPGSGIIQKLARHAARIKSEYAMLRTIKGLKNAIVHCDLLPTASLISLVVLALCGPVFVTAHNAMPPVPKWRYALWKVKFGLISLFRNFHLLCTNEHAANYFTQLFSKRVSDDLKVTYDSINVPEIDGARSAAFDRSQELGRFGIDPNKFIILTVGQFVDRKGRWTLLEAAERILETTRDIVFVWVAPNLPSEQDARRIEAYGLGDSFRLLKSADVGTDRRSILRFFRVADIFALPSFVEGIPIAMLEAMGIGIPCISTNVFGIPEAIIDGETGLLIEAGDPVGLAEAIVRLRRGPELREKIAARGRERAVTKFDEREAARIAVAAYKATMIGSAEKASKALGFEP